MLSLLTVARFVAICAVVSASPAPIPNPVAVAHPEVTPFRVQYEPTKTLERRENILSKIEGKVTSVLSALGSDVPAYVASGRLPFARLRRGSGLMVNRGAQFLPEFSYRRQS
jgi:hypothetical protein